MRLVRETPALTPEQERAGLQVPPGFTVQLFASEPMINKPINMAFDAKGRLWVSSTVEYPYSADKSRWSDEKGTSVKDSRDAIKILEDTDGDGKADKVTDFVGGLNIPTGVLPWHKPEHKAGCIAWSIPNIWYFADTDGDDKADHREILFGPLGYEKDTHGMCSSFRMGLDGWVYATHGFNNTSHLKAKDGSKLDLHSGNVFRFRPDGSHVEIWTRGQVNPFGLCWDRFGNLYSADCHSSPIYQLIRGACYPSFGKPHDGLGFAPVMCEHSHGSTGICGVVYLDGAVWGAEWDDHMLVGNCVTSRVNHDEVTFIGSTPKANEQPDFITSDDPWFRPVDLQLGPDNALYIADFYNKIIGHYEVPLDHPGRDKERGRIWRVVREGTKATKNDFTTMEPQQIIAELGNPNLTRRHFALGEVKRRGTDSWLRGVLACIEGEQKIEAQGNEVPPYYADPTASIDPGDAGMAIPSQTTMQAAYALWACSYLGERLNVYRVIRGLHNGGVWVEDAPHDDENYAISQRGLLMAHAAQVIGNNERLHPWEKWSLGIIFDARGSAAGRAATQVLLNRPDFLQNEPQWQAIAVKMLIRLLSDMIDPEKSEGNVPWQNPKDVSYILSMRILLRDFLSQPGVLKNEQWHDRVGKATSKPWFIEVIKAVPTPEASSWLMSRLEQGGSADAANWNHFARYGDDATLSRAIGKARQQTKAGTQSQMDAINAFYNGLMERGAKPPASLRSWAMELADSLLSQANKQPVPAWISTAPADSSPKWSLQTRKCEDGTEAKVLQSMAKGGGDEEKLTGVLKSKPFAAPEKLVFWINGHRGFPTAKAHDKNLVRVVDVQSGATLASVFPPRYNDCKLVEMDLSKHSGKPVRLEIVDGDDGKAYAWLGITRIEPAVISVNDFQNEDSTRSALKTLAMMLQHTAPAALREKLAAYLPPRPAPPPLPVSPEQRKQLDALIATRSAAFAKAKPDVAAGKTVFTTNCAVCHQIRGEGGLIGPQLDGIGARGAERLSEDILDPNRNVDAHFHLHTLTLKDGGTVSGFLKAEAGQVLILADATGQEQRVSKNDLAKDVTTPMSLMPPVFGQTLDEKTFINLLGYLMNEKAGE
jgi:putative heme-binding domain-containing protein